MDVDGGHSLFGKALPWSNGRIIAFQAIGSGSTPDGCTPFWNLFFFFVSCVLWSLAVGPTANTCSAEGEGAGLVAVVPSTDRVIPPLALQPPPSLLSRSSLTTALGVGGICRAPAVGLPRGRVRPAGHAPCAVEHPLPWSNDRSAAFQAIDSGPALDGRTCVLLASFLLDGWESVGAVPRSGLGGRLAPCTCGRAR